MYEYQTPHGHHQQTDIKRLLVLVCAFILLVAVGTVIYFWSNNQSPVPNQIKNSVSFPIYYPDQKHMPSGYVLDTKSFSNPLNKGVTYAVKYGNGQKIVFSVQPKPSDNEIQSFNSNYIPLRNHFQTPLGQVEIGSYHEQTLGSFPIINGPWIIITAPHDINQDQLKQVLGSLKS